MPYLRLRLPALPYHRTCYQWQPEVFGDVTRKARCCLVMYRIAVVFGSQDVQASSFLGISTIGARSHQAVIHRIGRELAARGHTFTMLFSHLDEVCISSFGSKRDPGFRTIVFQGAPFVGTEEWLRNLSRDPQQV